MPSIAELFGFSRPFGQPRWSQSSQEYDWPVWIWPPSATSGIGTPLREGTSYPDTSDLPSNGILGSYFGTRGNSGYASAGGILPNLASRFPQQTANDSGLLGPALAKAATNYLASSSTDPNSNGHDNQRDPIAEDAPYPALDPIDNLHPVQQLASGSTNTSQPTQPQPPGSIAFDPNSDRSDTPLAAPSVSNSSVVNQESPIATSSQGDLADRNSPFSRAYSRAQALISSDPELSATSALAERAGDKSFNTRLSSIIANLELNPEAARDALWREVFASGLRSSAESSLANAGADWAVQQAAKRFHNLRPDLGMLWAYNSARSALNELNRDQHQTLYRITNAPISPQRKWELMGESGLINWLLASTPLGDPSRLLSLLGSGALAGGLPPFGPGRARLPRRTTLADRESQTKDLLDSAERVRQIRSVRYMPGEGSGTLENIEGPWLFENPEALVPGQIATQLRGIKFSDFDEYRRTFWRSVVRVPELAKQFSSQNRALMANGQPPKAPESEHSPLGDMYHLHHIKRIEDNGDVYNAENIRVVTPKRHYEIHYGPLP